MTSKRSSTGGCANGSRYRPSSRCSSSKQDLRRLQRIKNLQQEQFREHSCPPREEEMLPSRKGGRIMLSFQVCMTGAKQSWITSLVQVGIGIMAMDISNKGGLVHMERQD